MQPVDAIAWWKHPDALHRFVCDVIAGELRAIRPGRSAAPSGWTPQTRLVEDLAIDSLERLKLATALAEIVHLERSGIDDGLLAGETIGEWTAVVSAGLDRYSTELTFRTSGSSGRPKWCPHALAELQAEVEILATLLASCSRIVTAVPSHHIYGFLFTILVPARLGIPVVDARPNAPSWLAGIVRSGDAVVAHPDYWAALVRTVERLPPAAIGVTSSAPCPPELPRRVAATGLGRLIDVYGSSETAGIGWRDDPAAGYALFEYWQRSGDLELTRRLVDGTERRVPIPDRLVWLDDRHVRPVGRLEGTVQIGGVNVVLEDVEAVLASHPGVARAAVRVMHPSEGDRLKAFIVPAASVRSQAVLEEQLWALIDVRLPAPERPKALTFGPALPTGLLGKPADWPIAPPSDPSL